AVGDVLLEELVDVRELGVGGVVGGGCGAGDVLRLVGGACGWPVAVAVLEGGGPVEGGAVGVVPAGGVVVEDAEGAQGGVDVVVVQPQVRGVAVGGPAEVGAGVAVGGGFQSGVVVVAEVDAEALLHGVAGFVGQHEGDGGLPVVFGEHGQQGGAVPGDGVDGGAVEGVAGDVGGGGRA